MFKRKQIANKKKIIGKNRFTFFLEGSFLIKAIAGLSTYLIIVGTLLLGTYPSPQKLVTGQIAPANIVAKVDFKYVDSSEKKKTEEKKIHKILLPYHLNDTVLKTALENVNRLFDLLEAIDPEDKMNIKEKISKAHTISSSFNLSEKNLKDLFLSKYFSEIRNLVLLILEKMLNEGVIASKENSLQGKTRIQLFNKENNRWIIISRERFYLIEESDEDIKKLIDLNNRRSLKEIDINLIVLIVSSQIKPNLSFDLDYYSFLKNKVIKTITPIYTFVKKGELILKRGDIVDQRNIDMLDAEFHTMIELQGWDYRGGISFLILILLIITIFYIKFFHHEIFKSNSKLLLLQLITAITIILSYFFGKTLMFFPSSEYFTPIAITAMLIALLLDYRLSVFFVLLLSLVTSLMAEEKTAYFITNITGGIIAIYSLFETRKRSSLIKAGFYSGIASALCVVAIGITNQIEPLFFLKESLWGLASGLLSAFIVMGILPYLEYFFKITTDIALLELSDFNHPLLKELVVKAPGTYHHSLIVGNLAEAAAEKVHANPLLARVQAYFHDIGKLNKPEYFSENEWHSSRHDELNPTMSSLIIVSHVKDGVDLALKAKLQKQIIDAIKEHHGTSIVYYFFKKAVNDSVEENRVKKEHFSYPGPKPQSKETAIIMLADSVEAASRSLTNPTPSRITKLVQDLINNRIIDGQLDESGLTMKDIKDIREAFIFILTSIFHTRKQYPAENREQITDDRERKSEKRRHRREGGGKGKTERNRELEN